MSTRPRSQRTAASSLQDDSIANDTNSIASEGVARRGPSQRSSGKARPNVAPQRNIKSDIKPMTSSALVPKGAASKIQMASLKGKPGAPKVEARVDDKDCIAPYGYMFPRSVFGFHPLTMLTVAQAVRDSVSSLSRTKIDWEDVRKRYIGLVSDRIDAMGANAHEEGELNHKTIQSAKRALNAMLPRRLSAFQCKALWRVAAYSILPRIGADGSFPNADIVPGDVFKSVPLAYGSMPEDDGDDEFDSEATDEDDSDNDSGDDGKEEVSAANEDNKAKGGKDSRSQRQKPKQKKNKLKEGEDLTSLIATGTYTPVLNSTLTLEDMRALSAHPPRTLTFKKGVAQLPSTLRKVGLDPACWTPNSDLALKMIDYKRLGAIPYKMPLYLAPDDQEISDIDMDTAATPGFEDCTLKYVSERISPHLTDPKKSLSDLLEITHQHSKWPPSAFAVQTAVSDYLSGDIPYRVIAPLRVPIPIPNPAQISRKLPPAPLNEAELKYQGHPIVDPIFSTPCHLSTNPSELGIPGGSARTHEALQSLAGIIPNRMRSHKARFGESAPVAFLAQAALSTQQDIIVSTSREGSDSQAGNTTNTLLPSAIESDNKSDPTSTPRREASDYSLAVQLRAPVASTIRERTQQVLSNSDVHADLGTCSTKPFGPVLRLSDSALMGSTGHIVDIIDESAQTLGVSDVRTGAISIVGTSQHLYDDNFIRKALDSSRKTEDMLKEAVVSKPLSEFGTRDPPFVFSLSRKAEASMIHPKVASNPAAILKRAEKLKSLLIKGENLVNLSENAPALGIKRERSDLRSPAGRDCKQVALG